MTAAITSTTPFQARWPKALDPAFESSISKISRLAWNIFSIVIFPVGIARLIGCYLRNLIYRITVPGNFSDEFAYMNTCKDESTCWNVAKEIMRLLFHPEALKADRTEEGKQVLQNFGGEAVTIKSPDGGVLHGAFIPGTYSKKVILCAGGNVEQWETFRWFEFLHPIGASMLSINPRGVGKSTGIRSEMGYALDYYTAYEWLIHTKGIDPEDIVFVGFSMGAANATNGASLIQQKYYDKKIKGFNISSFSSLRRVVRESTKDFPIVSMIAEYAMKLLGVEIHPAKAWNQLRGTRCLFYNYSDNIIPYEASLAKAAHAGSQAVQMHSLPGHNRKFTVDEKNTLHAQIRKALGIFSLYGSVVDRVSSSLPVQTIGNRG